MRELKYVVVVFVVGIFGKWCIEDYYINRSASGEYLEEGPDYPGNITVLKPGVDASEPPGVDDLHTIPVSDFAFVPTGPESLKPVTVDDVRWRHLDALATWDELNESQLRDAAKQWLRYKDEVPKALEKYAY